MICQSLLIIYLKESITTSKINPKIITTENETMTFNRCLSNI